MSHGIARTFELLREERGVSGDEEFELFVQITGGQVHIPGANTYIKNRETRETETGLLERIKHAGVNYSCSEFTFPQTQQPSHEEAANIEPDISQTEQKNVCCRFHLHYIQVEVAMRYESFQLLICGVIFIQICSVFVNKFPKYLRCSLFFLFGQTQGWDDYFSPV